ncbi:TRCF domain protein, partial [Bordetella pertussis B200]
QHIDNHSDLKQDCELLNSIPAIGPQAGNAILAVMHNRHIDSAQSLAAYLGVVPVQRQSGSSLNSCARLEAIQAMEELGSGFYLAMHDLEIRGTGEILGDSQSGNIQEVGFSMYNEMLNEAVRALKAGEEPDLDAPFNLACEVNLHAPALLPSDYCPDVHGRLAIYKRLSHADGEDDLIRIQEELIDRFGKLPEAAQTLLATHRLRLAAQPLGIVKIDASETQALLQFGAKTTVDPLRIIELVQRQRHIKLSGQDKLRVEIKAPQIAARADAVRAVLRALK